MFPPPPPPSSSSLFHGPFTTSLSTPLDVMISLFLFSLPFQDVFWRDETSSRLLNGRRRRMVSLFLSLSLPRTLWSNWLIIIELDIVHIRSCFIVRSPFNQSLSDDSIHIGYNMSTRSIVIFFFSSSSMVINLFYLLPHSCNTNELVCASLSCVFDSSALEFNLSFRRKQRKSTRKIIQKIKEVCHTVDSLLPSIS